MPITATAILGGVQAIQGGVQSISGNRNLKRLFNQRETYKTQDETYDYLNLAKNEAQTGYGAQTMQYLNNQADRSFSSSLGASVRLGANPSDIANLLDARLQAADKTASDSETIRMNKVGRVYEGLGRLQESLDAEFASKEALLKDKMAAEAQRVQSGEKNISGGLNTALGAFSAKSQMDLFKEANKLGKFKDTTTPTTSTTSLIGNIPGGAKSLLQPQNATLNTTLSSTNNIEVFRKFFPEAAKYLNL